MDRESSKLGRSSTLVSEGLASAGVEASAGDTLAEGDALADGFAVLPQAAKEKAITIAKVKISSLRRVFSFIFFPPKIRQFT
jgi:hypothetical protein